MSTKVLLSLVWIKKKIVPILKKNAVKRGAIFGSFARGKTKNKSLFDLVDLKSELEETLHRKVDIIIYNSHSLNAFVYMCYTKINHHDLGNVCLWHENFI